VQRDYVFGRLLTAIYILVLKGGNGFRKAYLPNMRFSAVDFGTESAVDDACGRIAMRRCLRVEAPDWVKRSELRAVLNQAREFSG
jgi:hypothetical protein